MAKNLVIVESPAKAKTIEKFLGKDFVVKSSFGHIRDLPSKGMNIDIESGTFEPTYAINDDKKKVVTELRKEAKDKEVWLAADEDREGEAIAWHVCHALKIDPKKTKRIVFHEITKPAILKAIEAPRVVNQDLVNAQQARRVLDRLVGYELSPVLWKKVQTGLSAGRVQSVAVRIIVEREREIEAFNATSSFKVTSEFDLGKAELKAELPKRIAESEEAQEFLKSCVGADFTVEDLETKPSKKSPSAPFTTSTLQQEASRKLGFSVKQTMMVAQGLYEAGHITYMRTDSLNLSELAQEAAAKEIESQYGRDHVSLRKYHTKSAGAQEAHEAIRPTHFEKHEAGKNAQEKKLYALIWKRTIASQMADAKLEKTTATIGISTREEKLVAKGEVVKFPGFLDVYFESSDDDDENDPLAKNMLPPIEVGQKLALNEMNALETFARPKPRYTEASLVKKLEEEGIGRPSTYAPTISTIMNRKYVEKGDREGVERELQLFTLKKDEVTENKKVEKTGAEKGKLFPTALGEVVNDFLVKHFPKVVDYGFTKAVEEDFDAVAEGKKIWNKMIADFYKPFHEIVESAADISRDEVGGTRELGTDPKTGKPIFARLGRFGPMIQMGTKDDEEKPKFASIPEGKDMKTITFEDALELFKLPRVIGKTKEGEDIKANFGRFGPYIQVGKLYVSIKPDDPFTITEEKARELYEAKLEFEKNKNIQVFEGTDIKVLNGRFGPYITDGKKNAKIPKDKDPAKLTLAECEELIKAAPDKKRRFAKK